MADSAVPVSGGSGYNVDTRTESINGDHRQVVVLGDPVTGANVTTVDSSGRAYAAISGMPTGTAGPTAIQTTGSFTSLQLNVSNAGNITIWLSGTNTASPASVTTGNCNFEQSYDGVSWSALQVVRSDVGNSITTYGGTIASGVALAFDAAVEGVAYVRVRPTANSSVGTLYAVIVSGGLPFSPSVTLTGNPAVAGQTLTKGTQGTAGFSTQDLKDAGRVVFTFAGTAVAGVTTEALLSGTTQKGATQGTAVTAPAVTSGKTLRISAMDVSLRSGAAAIAWSRFILRTTFSSTGVATTSPILAQIELITGSATSGAGDRAHLDFPDGIELASTVSFGISHVGSATTNIETFSLTGFEY